MIGTREGRKYLQNQNKIKYEERENEIEKNKRKKTRSEKKPDFRYLSSLLQIEVSERYFPNNSQINEKECQIRLFCREIKGD